MRGRGSLYCKKIFLYVLFLGPTLRGEFYYGERGWVVRWVNDVFCERGRRGGVGVGCFGGGWIFVCAWGVFVRECERGVLNRGRFVLQGIFHSYGVVFCDLCLCVIEELTRGEKTQLGSKALVGCEVFYNLVNISLTLSSFRPYSRILRVRVLCKEGK